ncbi:hypothetical protein ACFQO4_00350 [Saliphagus sp. GCM10025334]
MATQTTTYEAVGAPRCRAVCQYLAATESTMVTLEEVATHVATDEQTESDSSVADRGFYQRILIELHHRHLPKLADAAVLQYDVDQKTIYVESELPAAIELIKIMQKPTENATPNP